MQYYSNTAAHILIACVLLPDSFRFGLQFQHPVLLHLMLTAMSRQPTVVIEYLMSVSHKPLQV